MGYDRKMEKERRGLSCCFFFFFFFGISVKLQELVGQITTGFSCYFPFRFDFRTRALAFSLSLSLQDDESQDVEVGTMNRAPPTFPPRNDYPNHRPRYKFIVTVMLLLWIKSTGGRSWHRTSRSLR